MFRRPFRCHPGTTWASTTSRLESRFALGPYPQLPGPHALLGHYAEGAPQVIDWQIKWAAEHGIRFFVVDTSWDSHGSGWRRSSSKRIRVKIQVFIQFSLLYGNGVASMSVDEFLR